MGQQSSQSETFAEEEIPTLRASARAQERIQALATYTYLLGYSIPLSVTSFLALRRGELSLAIALGVFAAIALFILCHVYIHGLGFRVRTLLVAATCMLFLFILLSGGYANTGLFWCFAMIVTIYHFSTAIVGLTINLSLIALSGLLLLTPGFEHLHPDYEAPVVSRFLLAGSLTTLLIFFYAKMREILSRRLQDTQDQLFRTSMTDDLTGLSNRRAMNAQLRRAERRGTTPRELALAIADIDHFKSVNDNLGHDAGDEVLRHVAAVLSNALRESDRVARWGGEEFLMLLDVRSSEEAEEVLERARSAIDNTAADYEGHRVPVTASFGMKFVTSSEHSLQDAIVEADHNLLKAKELGRNRVVSS